MRPPIPVLVIFIKSSIERARPLLPDAMVVITAFLSPSSTPPQVSSGAPEDSTGCCIDDISIVPSCTSPNVILLVEVLREAQSKGFVGVTAVDSVDVCYCCLAGQSSTLDKMRESNITSGKYQFSDIDLSRLQGVELQGT